MNYEHIIIKYNMTLIEIGSECFIQNLYSYLNHWNVYDIYVYIIIIWMFFLNCLYYIVMLLLLDIWRNFIYYQRNVILWRNIFIFSVMLHMLIKRICCFKFIFICNVHFFYYKYIYVKFIVWGWVYYNHIYDYNHLHPHL